MNTSHDISEFLELTAKLMELHGENPFKIKALNSASYRISKMNLDFGSASSQELEKIEGIGKSIAAKIVEINETGTTAEFQGLLKKTPSGLLELFRIKGLGPKKIAQLWKELQVETSGELLYACNENRLLKLKGFGEKTQAEIKKSIEFLFANKEKYHYAYALNYVTLFMREMYTLFPGIKIAVTGELYRKCEVISLFEILVSEKYADEVAELASHQGYPYKVHACSDTEFHYHLVETSSTPEHLHLVDFSRLSIKNQNSELEVYQDLGLPFIIPEMREGIVENTILNSQQNPNIIEYSHLKGCLHNHSIYSDGLNTIEEMALACKEIGLEYFGICDHSQSAVYANGLKPEAIMIQHAEIDELNAKLFPFKIFKGIESDILSDGSLDYSEDVLKTFDFIVASIHQGFNMDENRATERIIKAIENPYTKILGHPTGRLLLTRPGYPINHKKIIDACSANGVAIELNAHPYRLDIDWRWIPYCMEKNVLISINPDAHEKSALGDMYFGVCAARKGMLDKAFCLNAKSLKELESFWT